MAYKRTVWQNGKTPLNATNLNNIEEGIKEALDQGTQIQNLATNDIGNLAAKMGVKKTDSGYSIDADNTNFNTLLNEISNNTEYQSLLNLFNTETLKNSLIYLLLSECMTRVQNVNAINSAISKIAFIIGQEGAPAIPDEENPIKGTSAWMGANDRTYTDVINTLMTILVGGDPITLSNNIETTENGLVYDRIKEKIDEWKTEFNTEFKGNPINDKINTYQGVLAYIEAHKTEFNNIKDTIIDKNKSFDESIKSINDILDKLEGNAKTEGSILNLIQSEHDKHHKIGFGTADPTKESEASGLAQYDFYFRLVQ